MIESSDWYTSYPGTAWRQVAAERPPFLVDQVISGLVTLIYGQSEAGKSMLAQGLSVALTTGAPTFLGRGVTEYRTRNVAVLCGDYDDGTLYGERVERAGGDLGRLHLYDASAHLPFSRYDMLARDLTDQRADVLIIDNLSSFVPGDINQGPPCQQFFDAIGTFVRHKIAVVVLAHSSEKRAGHGQAMQDFIGHSGIKQRPSWHCLVRRGDDATTLTHHGNRGGRSETVVHLAKPDTPLYDVVSTADNDELARRKRTRSSKVKARADNISDVVLAECQGMNGKQAAALLAPRFKLAAGTIESGLSQGRYGVKQITPGAWGTVPKAA